MRPTNCSVRIVYTVSTFDIKTIAMILYISITTPHPEYRQMFIVQNLPVAIKHPVVHTIQTG